MMGWAAPGASRLATVQIAPRFRSPRGSDRVAVQIASRRCNHWKANQPGTVGNQKVTVR